MGRKEAGKGGQGEKHCTVEFAGKRYLWFPLKSPLNRVSWILAGRDSGEGKYLNPLENFMCCYNTCRLCVWVCECVFVFSTYRERERERGRWLCTCIQKLLQILWAGRETGGFVCGNFFFFLWWQGWNLWDGILLDIFFLSTHTEPYGSPQDQLYTVS